MGYSLVTTIHGQAPIGRLMFKAVSLLVPITSTSEVSNPRWAAATVHSPADSASQLEQQGVAIKRAMGQAKGFYSGRLNRWFWLGWNSTIALVIVSALRFNTPRNDAISFAVLGANMKLEKHENDEGAFGPANPVEDGKQESRRA